jgi:phosphate uptake regulator
VVAARDEVDAAVEHLLRGLRREAEAARGVLAVRDDGVDRVLGARRCETTLERIAAGGADDVADDEDGDRFDEGAATF